MGDQGKVENLKNANYKKNTSMFSSTSSLCFLGRDNNRFTKLAKISKSLWYHDLGFINFLSNFKGGLPLLWWQGGCCCRALGKLHHVAFACFRHHRGCALRICRLVTIKSVGVLAVAPWYFFWTSYWKPESPLLWSCCHVDAEFGRGIRVWLALNICIWS